MRAGMQRLTVTEATTTSRHTSADGEPDAQSAQALSPPLSTYQMEPDLARTCAQADAAAADSGRQRKQSLHLAVLGHVDAGKSTLMGRLMHELG